MKPTTFEKELEVSTFKGTKFTRFMDYTLEDVLTAKNKAKKEILTDILISSFLSQSFDGKEKKVILVEEAKRIIKEKL